MWSRVFILPTVKLSMDGWKLNWSWRAGGREVEWYVEQMCKCRRTEKQFIFYSLPWMLRITVWRVSNKPWSNFVFRDKRCLKVKNCTVKTEGSMTTADKVSSTEKGKHDKLFKLHEQYKKKWKSFLIIRRLFFYYQVKKLHITFCNIKRNTYHMISV